MAPEGSTRDTLTGLSPAVVAVATVGQAARAAMAKFVASLARGAAG